LMKKVLSDRVESENVRDKNLYTALVTNGLLKNNVGLLLTNIELNEILGVLEKHKVQAPARAGAIAPVEVIVLAGNTGLEPTQTSFFQALNVPTKISKGTVEITKDIIILRPGDRVGNSEATLLAKLKIHPFYYGLECLHIYDNGAVYGPEALKMTDETIGAAVAEGISELSALSLGLGVANQASLPHLLLNAFKDILAVTLAIDYDVVEFGAKDIKKAIKEGKAIGGGGGGAPAKGSEAGHGKTSAAPVAAKVEEEEEETVTDFGLFD